MKRTRVERNRGGGEGEERGFGMRRSVEGGEMGRGKEGF